MYYNAHTYEDEDNALLHTLALLVFSNQPLFHLTRDQKGHFTSCNVA